MKVRNSAMDSRRGSVQSAKLGAVVSAFAVVASASCGLGLGFEGVARADSPSPADQALATTLFREGRRLMEAGQIDQACEKLAESQRLEPGGGTLLNLAACHEKQGRTASAWTEFNAALAQARRDARDDRARAASERIASIEARLSTLTIRVTPPATDVTVTLDQTPVRSPAWGVGVPVDPGEHVIEATAPHKRPWRAKVVVGADHDAQTAQVPLLEDETATGAVVPAIVTPPSPKGAENNASNVSPPIAADANVSPSRSSSHAGRDGVTIAVGVVGLAGVAVGTIFGLRAISKHEDSDRECPNGLCTRDGAALNDSAHAAGNVSTVAFAVGAAGLGAAAILFFTRPSSSASSGSARTSLPIAGASPNGAFVGWRASF